MTQKQEKAKNVKIPSIDELAEAGVHLGHITAKRAPEMKPYIYGIKNTIHVIDLEKTKEKLEQAIDFLFKTAAEGNIILFVGTKAPAKDLIKKYAGEANVSYVTERWLGGTLTNFSSIFGLIKKLNTMTKEKEQGEWEGKYTKKEQLERQRELSRLEKMVGGLKSLEKKPEVLFVIDIQNEKTAVKEARKCKIPIIAMVDTDANPELVDWPIPCNDEAIKSIDLILRVATEAIKNGKQCEKAKEKNK